MYEQLLEKIVHWITDLSLHLILRLVESHLIQRDCNGAGVNHCYASTMSNPQAEIAAAAVTRSAVL